MASTWINELGGEDELVWIAFLFVPNAPGNKCESLYEMRVLHLKDSQEEVLKIHKALRKMWFT